MLKIVTKFVTDTPKTDGKGRRKRIGRRAENKNKRKMARDLKHKKQKKTKNPIFFLIKKDL